VTAASPRQASLEVRDLEVERPSLRVGPLDLSLGRGECAALVGPNGSGKSTLLLGLLGLLRAARGEVWINGARVTSSSPPTGTGVVLSWCGLYPWVSGEENLKLAAEGDREALGRVPRLLDAVGLTEAARRRVGDYSTGMVKRLEMARALLFEPALLVLDEPTNGLDARAREWLTGQLLDRLDRGNAVVVATHDDELVSEIATQRFRLFGGAVQPVAFGS
jgi:ABC-2 type transport system ATP-binding protein